MSRNLDVGHWDREREKEREMLKEGHVGRRITDLPIPTLYVINTYSTGVDCGVRRIECA